MDFSEKCAKDVDSAVKLALEDLQLSIDEVDVTVLEEPSRGFFGIGSKLALVRVEKKKKETKATKEPLIEKVEYVNMRPTIAGLGAGRASARADIHAIQILRERR